MGSKTQDHHEKDAKTPLVPEQDGQEQAPIHENAPPSNAVRRARSEPGRLKSTDVSALQRSVGNRAVQRLVSRKAQDGVVQRHVPPNADVAFRSNLPGLRGFTSGMYDQIEGVRGIYNALLNAAEASAHFPAGGEGETAPPVEQQSQGVSAGGEMEEQREGGAARLD
jgi:hypothetical protein